MAHGQSTPHAHRDEKGRLRLIAGMISGITCLVLVPVLYRLAGLVSDSLFGPAAIQTAYEGARVVAPRRWVGGLLVAFVASLALLTSAQVRSRIRLTVKQYWVVTILLGVLCLLASLALHGLG